MPHAAPSLPQATRHLLDIYEAMETMHAWRGWHWWPDANPFEVIVGAILVQNTMWTNVERALDRLRAARALTPEAMAALSQPELEELVRPSGQYRQKARKLRAFLDLVRAHGSLDDLLALPPAELRARLLATWGIGPETADCILLYAAKYPSFIVDAYMVRIYGRLGLGPDPAAGYAAWQHFFESNLAPELLPPPSSLLPAGSDAGGGQLRDVWARYRALIVLHAKHLCLKNRPKCNECLLRERCPGPPLAPPRSES
jgi:endonuclease-3 related protein